MVEREVNQYLVSIAVNSWQLAKLLGSETNWKILEALRVEGIEGLTVKELSENTKIPKSTIYNGLEKLQAAELVKSSMRRYSWGRPTKEVKQRFGKPTRVYVSNVVYGRVETEEDFHDNLELILEVLETDTDFHLDTMKKEWLDVLDKIVSIFKTDEHNEFYPREPIHEECGWSHEAQEFLIAISLALLFRNIVEDDDFYELARKHNFHR